MIVLVSAVKTRNQSVSALSQELVDFGTDLHIPGKATEVMAAAVASAVPSDCRPSVWRVYSAAWTLASSTAAHSLAGVKGCLQENMQSVSDAETAQNWAVSDIHNLMERLLLAKLIPIFKLYTVGWLSLMSSVSPPVICLGLMAEGGGAVPWSLPGGELDLLAWEEAGSLGRTKRAVRYCWKWNLQVSSYLLFRWRNVMEESWCQQCRFICRVRRK